MQSHTRSSWKRHTLWLSLLAHLLFLLSLAVYVVNDTNDKLPSSSSEAVQSYLTQDPAPPAPPARQEEAVKSVEPAPPVEAPPVEKTEPKKVDDNGIEKPISTKPQEKKVAAKPVPSRKPHAPSFSKDTVPEDITDPRDEEPLHLIGESRIIKPLVKILARALSRHLMYPRVAAELNMRGTVLVGFVIHPEGHVTDARVVKSSGAGVLDDAARDAVGDMSPVGDVHEYVSAPEYLVVGIIFG